MKRFPLKTLRRNLKLKTKRIRGPRTIFILFLIVLAGLHGLAGAGEYGRPKGFYLEDEKYGAGCKTGKYESCGEKDTREKGKDEGKGKEFQKGKRIVPVGELSQTPSRDLRPRMITSESGSFLTAPNNPTNWPSARFAPPQGTNGSHVITSPLTHAKGLK